MRGLALTLISSTERLADSDEHMMTESCLQLAFNPNNREVCLG